MADFERTIFDDLDNMVRERNQEIREKEHNEEANWDEEAEKFKKQVNMPDSVRVGQCDHQCTGNCRRVGCNCECGEWHEVPRSIPITESDENVKTELKIN